MFYTHREKKENLRSKKTSCDTSDFSFFRQNLFLHPVLLAKVQELKGSTKIVEGPQKLCNVQKMIFAVLEVQTNLKIRQGTFYVVGCYLKLCICL